MASDDNDPRRNRDRPEDNPFIAFRRFADSQVSSLLNTVFTLPATIANYRNVHIAREQCLFGRADKQTCKDLHEIEEETAKVLAECRELYRTGNLDQALQKGEDLMRLNYVADMLRKEIVEQGKGGHGEPVQSRWGNISGADNSSELVEKVANEKGQQWGWSWDWGFPRPFDAEEGAPSRSDRCRRWRQRREESAATLKQTEENSDASDMRPILGHEQQSQWLSQLEQQRKHHLEQLARDQSDDEWDDWTRKWDDFMKPILEELSRRENSSANVFSTMGQNTAGTEELTRLEGQWRDAFEDLLRTERGLPLMPPERLGQSNDMSHDQWERRFWDAKDRSFVGRQSTNEYPKHVPWEGEETAEEPNYEYSHDHEDQHDEPPTPKTKQGQWSSDMPETELEAYERLLGPIPAPGAPSQAEGRPSVLSTLTTTERTVGPDGTVTTKVVLKKRFVDGREESSETVHTQRGQETEAQQQDPWKTIQEAQHAAQEQSQNGKDKKAGWFWSS
ncbi:hypothetical protein N0V90_008631 [Kalmusia sp. IMI 367209]|nr:hypothetical protein N0V90_008631 [Kalmusia sp. IMI 367209]